MQTIVITGANGFIGSALVRKAIEKKYEPVALLRERANLTRLESLPLKKKIAYNDLSDSQLLFELKSFSPDIFVHLAWKGTTENNKNEKYQITENIETTLKSIELAYASGCKHWIGIGSQTEYGNPNKKISENTPTSPKSLYGKAKLAACWASMGLCESLGMKSSWLRIFSTYGVGDNPTRFLTYLIRELQLGNIPTLTKCEQLWDFLHISDLTDAIVSIITSEAEGIYNIGMGETVLLRDVVESVKNSINPNSKINYTKEYSADQVMHLEADISKIKIKTGWMPKVTIEEGIKLLLDSSIKSH